MRSAPRRNKEFHVLDPESIRNASFSLMPTGYNPEQVDDALNLIAERLVAGDGSADLVGRVSFEVVDVGYAKPEVDHFFAELAEEAAASADHPVQDEEPAQEEMAAEAATAGEEPASEGEPGEPETAAETQPAQQAADGVEDVEYQAMEFHELAGELEPIEAQGDADEGDESEEQCAESDDRVEETDAVDGMYVGAPRELGWRSPTGGVLDLDVLGEAVDRTAETLSSLRGFIDNEIVAMKLAVERQAQETAKLCEQLLHDASTEAAALTESVNAEIARARKAAERQAERDRRELAKDLKQARDRCDTEIAAARRDGEEYAAKLRAEADRDRAEAQRTIENAIGMQASIAESLERARQQLTPAQRDDLAA
jgi:DivIVA domain-containing protein